MPRKAAPKKPKPPAPPAPPKGRPPLFTDESINWTFRIPEALLEILLEKDTQAAVSIYKVMKDRESRDRFCKKFEALWGRSKEMLK